MKSINRDDVKLPTQGWEYDLQIWSLREERKGILLEFLCLLPGIVLTLLALWISVGHDGLSRFEGGALTMTCFLFLVLILRTAWRCGRINDEIRKTLKKAVEKSKEISTALK